MRLLWLLAIIAVVVGSLLPGGCEALRVLAVVHLNDKAQHFLAYALLAAFPAWLEPRPAALVACLKLVALGVLLEFLQLFVPGRACELLDGVADLGGVVCGFALSGATAAIYSRTRMVRTGASAGTPA